MTNQKNKGVRYLWALLFLMILGEIGLHLLCWMNPAFRDSLYPETPLIQIASGTLQQDPILDFRPIPLTFEHDQHGFRNPPGISSAEVVTMGNQETYGEGVRLDQTWPARLQDLIGKKVYNMGVPGYGPVHSFLLLKESQLLHPKQLIVGFNLTDDLKDTYLKIYGDDHWIDFRTTDSAKLQKILDLERVRPLSSRRNPFVETVASQSPFLFLEKYSTLYRFVRKTIKKMQLLIHPPSTLESQEKTNENVFEYGGIRYHLNTQEHLKALERTDERISEGLQESLRVFSLMAEAVKKEKQDLLILIFPTKESVLAPLIEQKSYPVLDSYKKLINDEALVREKVRDYFKTQGIVFIDLLLPFQDALLEGHSPYEPGSDHLNVGGQELVAAEIAAWIKESAFREKHDQLRSSKMQKELKQEVRQHLNRRVFLIVWAGFSILGLIGIPLQTKFRPLFLLMIYLGLVIFQIVIPTDFFPLSSFQIVKAPQQQYVTYRKLVAVLENGARVDYAPGRILPVLAGGRAGYLIQKGIKNSTLAKELIEAYIQIYEQNYRDSQAPGIREVWLEDWKWDFIRDPFDPEKGFMIRRIVAKPKMEAVHAGT